MHKQNNRENGYKIIYKKRICREGGIVAQVNLCDQSSPVGGHIIGQQKWQKWGQLRYRKFRIQLPSMRTFHSENSKAIAITFFSLYVN